MYEVKIVNVRRNVDCCEKKTIFFFSVCVSDNVDMKIKPDKLRKFGICVLKHITYHKNLTPKKVCKISETGYSMH